MATPFSLDNIATQFNAAAQNYSNTLQPYVIKLFFSLLLIDIVVTYVQYAADQLEPMHYLGRLIRHVLGGGFVYAMILHGFTWMGWVILSFGQLGKTISGIPALSPGSIYATGSDLAGTLMNSPTTAGLISSIELALLEGFMALVVWGCFLFTAVELLLTLVRGYMTTSVGVVLLAFGGNRYTSNLPEGYFAHIVRIGTKILFIYATLGIAMAIVTSLQASLKAACNPVPTAVPWITSYFTPPKSIMTTVCTGTISLSDMANFAGLAVMFVALCVGVPRMAGELVGGPLGHALEDLASAFYIGRSVAAPAIGGAAGAASWAIRGAAAGAAEMYRQAYPSEAAMQSFAASVAAQAHARNATQPTQPLDPFSGGQPPGYNMRPPNGPALPPSNGSGGSGAALEYIPGQPGHRTRAEAIDITKLQKKS